jgi:hypothetical protein
MGFLRVLVRELQTKPWLHGFGKRVVEPECKTAEQGPPPGKPPTFRERIKDGLHQFMKCPGGLRLWF